MLWTIPAVQPGAAVPFDPDLKTEDLRWASVVPLPLEAQRTSGTWNLGAEVLVDWGPLEDRERRDLAERLDLTLGPVSRSWRATGTLGPVAPGPGSTITFSDQGPGGEGYRLSLTPQGVLVEAADPPGRFYALVTLGQLLPSRASRLDPVSVATGVIGDSPRYSWRGLMLDSSRHFQSVETLEWVLELMARHKLNRFHWHLTDDQGWRLEVPSWPKLTSVGGWRTEAEGPYGGFYTAADVTRLVAFAAQRHIVVVPEIDLPGHSSAALAAYPELSATGEPREVPLEWGVADGVLSLGRPSVVRFLGDVLDTLTDLFPGPWIHWGGDEVYRTPWMRNLESQAWMRRVGVSTPEQALEVWWQELVAQTEAAGKQAIGWDETALYRAPSVVQWWDSPSRARVALAAGRPLIASVKESTYLDYPEFAWDGDKAFWMPSLTLDTVAAQPFWPPGTPARQRELVLGVEATLFTERAPETKLGRKLFPRLALVAELAWRGQTVAGWSSRLTEHRERLEAWGVGMVSPLR